jgi:hypothetical protein
MNRRTLIVESGPIAEIVEIISGISLRSQAVFTHRRLELRGSVLRPGARRNFDVQICNEAKQTLKQSIIEKYSEYLI